MAHLPRGLILGLLALTGPAAAAPGAPQAPEATARTEGGDKPVAAKPVVLANHRAVYDLSLGSSGGGARAVEAARGRIVIDFRGDACRGYTMQTRQVTELTSGETGARLSDMRSTTFESGDGHEFRFKTTTLTDNQPAAPVDGTATEGRDGLSVRLKGQAKPVTEDGAVLFPSAHMKRLVEAARAGTTTLSAKVYDGSDDGRKIYDTFAVIGHEVDGPPASGPSTASDAERDKPLRTGAIASVPHWPVSLTYYTAGIGERTPIYTLGFDLYENGVSGRIKLDYGEFSILGDMTSLEIDPDRPAGADGKGCAP